MKKADLEKLVLSLGGNKADIECFQVIHDFLEAHPDPNNAKCDGPSALPLDMLEPFLHQMKTIDDAVKNFPVLDIK